MTSWSESTERTSLLRPSRRSGFFYDDNQVSYAAVNYSEGDRIRTADPGGGGGEADAASSEDEHDGKREEQSATEEDDKEGAVPLYGSVNYISDRFECLDYDICENAPYLAEEKEQTYASIVIQNVHRWLVMLMIGVSTALIACFIDICITEISAVKYSHISRVLENFKESNQEGLIVLPYLTWLAYNVGLVFIASVLVAYVEPCAAGSGIPQIKCFLNGIKIQRVVRVKTLVAKVLGVLFSVSGGLAVGKEGPMIHSGAILAAGISQGRTSTFRRDCNFYHYFRNDHEKRDFVSGGAAAGVAAAFGAPVGGVLFSLEEGASFWNQMLTWRIFFASMISTFTLNIFLSAYHGLPGQLSYPGLLNFGKFTSLSYTAPEMGVFVLLGVIGGLLGAVFNLINHRLSEFRMRHVYRRWAQVIEAVLVAAASATIGYLLIYFTHDCQPLGKDPGKHPVQMYCNDGEYSAMASLFFQTPEESVRSLFHDEPGSFRPQTLCLFVVCYFFLACWTYGVSVPSGLFIPCLLTGAAWGRLIGIGLKYAFPQAAWIAPGKYALIGAAAQLGGVVRMTISLTVILIEATGDITFGLPLMIVLMTAKWVGDYFNEGLYDIHVQLQGVPFLEWEPPPLSSNISATDVMSHPVLTLNTREKVSKVMQMLQTTTHHGFPVVDGSGTGEAGSDTRASGSGTRASGSDTRATGSGTRATGSGTRASGSGTRADTQDVRTFGKFRGIILRSQLMVLLKHKAFKAPGRRPLTLPASAFREFYQDSHSLKTINISAREQDYTLDLLPYMNPATYTVSCQASLPRIFRLFRGLGLRHLVVTSGDNEVIGIVTRKDLARYRVWTHRGEMGLEELLISQG